MPASFDMPLSIDLERRAGVDMQELEALRQHLRALYAGVLNERQVDQHLDDYVELDVAQEQVGLCVQIRGLSQRVLDIGAGFGSFVLAARAQGLNAVGIEVAEFETAFARRRLRWQRPQDDPEAVYFVTQLPFS